MATVSALIDGRYRVAGESVWRGGVEQVVIDVVDAAVCEHCFTMCGECRADWECDYLILS